MLTNARIGAVIPVTDLDRAREFYEGVLGLQVLRVDAARGFVFYVSGATYLQIYTRQAASSGEHTIAGFELGSDFDAVVDGLIARGIMFDTWTVPGVELPWDKRGVLKEGGGGAAWFKDPDGNILVITGGALS